MNFLPRFSNKKCLLRIAQDARKHLNTDIDIHYPKKIIPWVNLGFILSRESSKSQERYLGLIRK
jgi:hypothetical protein